MHDPVGVYTVRPNRPSKQHYEKDARTSHKKTISTIVHALENFKIFQKVTHLSKSTMTKTGPGTRKTDAAAKKTNTSKETNKEVAGAGGVKTRSTAAKGTEKTANPTVAETTVADQKGENKDNEVVEIHPETTKIKDVFNWDDVVKVSASNTAKKIVFIEHAKIINVISCLCSSLGV